MITLALRWLEIKAYWRGKTLPELAKHGLRAAFMLDCKTKAEKDN
jgi:hypothetical protein